MRKSWPYLALTAASLATGGFAGWAIRGKPPAPEVIIKYRESESAKSNNESAQAASASSSIFVVSPASVSNRKIKRYHPPGPVVACPAPGQPCVCPGPALAEEEEITTNTGPGTIASSAQSASTASQKGSAESTSDKSGESHSQPVEKNWHASFMPGLSLKEPPVEVPGLPHAVIGGSVERKVFSIGNVDASIGLWGSSAVAGGVSFGARF